MLSQWVVRALLEEGFAVRGAVRSADKCAHLQDIFASYGDKFELVVVPDITKVGIPLVSRILYASCLKFGFCRKALSMRRFRT
jgi:hypothetical protein